jgi:NAD-dependent deacetylase
LPVCPGWLPLIHFGPLEVGSRSDSLFLCTQNIDDLHARAGSERVVHMHGELLKARCTACGETMPWRDDLSVEVPCPSCRRSGGLRPHVVWFGEMPLEMDAIYDALLGADLFVAIGTSGSVYPAAGFVSEARGSTRTTAEPTRSTTLVTACE